MQVAAGDDLEQRLKVRISGLTTLHAKVRKVDKALLDLPNLSKGAQAKLLTSAINYLQAPEARPVGTSKVIAKVTNELRSIKEGIASGVVSKNDMVLLSGKEAIADLAKKLEAANAQLAAAVNGGILDNTNLSPEEQLLLRNSKLKDKIPAFNGKDFVLARAPVAFTFANKKHTSVGYLNKEILDKLGFKSDNLGGYTILYKQLVLGVDPAAAYNREFDIDNNQVSFEKKKVKERTLTYKGGKPTFVQKNVEVKQIDQAERILKLIAKKTGIEYTFVSEYGVGHKDGYFFWIIPAKDAARLARAFPGGMNKISKWGFAF